MTKRNVPEFLIAWNEADPSDAYAHYATRHGAAVVKVCNEQRLAPWEWFPDPRATVVCIPCFRRALQLMSARLRR